MRHRVFIFIVISLPFLFYAIKSSIARQKPNDARLTGRILIQLTDPSYIYEYSQSVKNGLLRLIAKSKVKIGEAALGYTFGPLWLSRWEQNDKRKRQVESKLNFVNMKYKIEISNVDGIYVSPKLNYVLYDGSYNDSYLINLDSLKAELLPFNSLAFDWGPEGQYLALAVEGTKPLVSNEFVIIELQSNKIVQRRNLNRTIRGISWSPRGSALAILTSSWRRGYGLLDLLFACAGHPSEYYSFYVEIYTTHNQQLLERPIIQDLRHGQGDIIWIDK